MDGDDKHAKHERRKKLAARAWCVGKWMYAVGSLLMARARGAVLRAPLRRAIAAWKAHRPPSLRLAPRRPQQRGDFVCSAYAHMPRASLAPRR